jgi:hypothetical protein
LALASGACHEEDSTYLARLETPHGTVSIEAAAKPRPAVGGDLLHEGDVVETGPQSGATVVFRPGDSLALGPNTRLALSRDGTAVAELRAVVLSGSVHATSSGAFSFYLGVPSATASFGSMQAELDVSANDGFAVRVGTVEVGLATGGTATIAAGQSLTLAGLVVPLGPGPHPAKKPSAPITLAVIAGDPRQVQIQGTGREAWVAAGRRATMGAGDAVRTRAANGTRLEMAQVASVDLAPKTELAVQAAEADQSGPRGRYSLKQGAVHLHSQRRDDQLPVHEVETPAGTIRVAPGLETADVEISAAADLSTRILVRLGDVTLPSGETIPPGSAARLHDGKLDLQPLAATFVEVSPEAKTNIHVDDDVPAVRFLWKSAEAKPTPSTIEVARDRRYQEFLFRETVPGNDLVYDRLALGRYFWRVRTGAVQQEGQVEVDRASARPCSRCQRRNTVDETGESTIVQFQKALPSITLRWQSVANASKYRIKVFVDGALETPQVDQLVDNTTLALAGGRLKEGHYFWFVQALDAQSNDMGKSRMNTLSIARNYDVEDLELWTPRPAAKPKAGPLAVTGQIPSGRRLTINGVQVEVDSRGIFSHTLALGKGPNQLVIRTSGASGPVQYFVREIRGI